MKPELYRELTVRSKTKLVILFHGIFGSSSTADMIAAKKVFGKLGFSVLCFDYPGHGKSFGSINDISLSVILDSIGALSETIDKYQKIYLLGFSFGAYPAIDFASKNRKVKGMILINPATDMLRLIFRKKTYDDLDNHVKSHRNVSLNTKIKNFIECLKHNNYSKAKKISCPVYAYHIINDRSVPVFQTKKLERHISSSKRFIYPLGSNHGLSIEIKNKEFEKRILPDALDWILNS